MVSTPCSDTTSISSGLNPGIEASSANSVAVCRMTSARKTAGAIPRAPVPVDTSFNKCVISRGKVNRSRQGSQPVMVVILHPKKCHLLLGFLVPGEGIPGSPSRPTWPLRLQPDGVFEVLEETLSNRVRFAVWGREFAQQLPLALGQPRGNH